MAGDVAREGSRREECGSGPHGEEARAVVMGRLGKITVGETSSKKTPSGLGTRRRGLDQSRQVDCVCTPFCFPTPGAGLLFVV